METNDNDKKLYKSELFEIVSPIKKPKQERKYDNLEEGIKVFLADKFKERALKSEELMTILNDIYKIEEDTVYLLLINGHVVGFDYGGCLNEPKKNTVEEKVKKKCIFAKKKIGKTTTFDLSPTVSQLKGDKQPKQYNIYFLSLDSFAKLNDPVNRFYSLRKYILIAIYRDVIRYKLQERYMREKGNRRCIFTTSAYEELSNTIYAIKYPIICYTARKGIKKKWREKNKGDKTEEIGIDIAKKELKKLRPIYPVDRVLVRLQSYPIGFYILTAIIIPIIIGLIIKGGGDLADLIRNAVCCK